MLFGLLFVCSHVFAREKYFSISRAFLYAGKSAVESSHAAHAEGDFEKVTHKNRRAVLHVRVIVSSLVLSFSRLSLDYSRLARAVPVV